jgi:hypothetical protein
MIGVIARVSGGTVSALRGYEQGGSENIITLAIDSMMQFPGRGEVTFTVDEFREFVRMLGVV